MNNPVVICEQCGGSDWVRCPWGGHDCATCDKGHHDGPDWAEPFSNVRELRPHTWNSDDPDQETPA